MTVATQEIQGQAKTVRQLLGVKYAVDYYQREYKWETKQVQELIEDLTSKFFDNYRGDHNRGAVQRYGRYFLGSIIISRKDGDNFIVDGQQRLTSLTLLLIYLRNLQRERNDKVSIDDLIYSERYGEKSFNLDVPKRLPAMEALFDEIPFDETSHEESVQNIVARYRDIEELFPTELTGTALPYFIDWLVENVHLVEITAFSDEEAYTNFETMNDRGLSLTPTEMLKGFLLASISDEHKKTLGNELWRKRTQELAEYGKETEADFFKSWLRSQYAQKIRERKRGARPEDFDRLGTEFHRWVRDHATDKDDDHLTLKFSDDFHEFIQRDFAFFSRQYMLLMEASRTLVPGLEHILYNAKLGFTLQYMLLLAPLRPDDSDEVAREKMRLVAMFLDSLLAWRILNFRSITYSTMQYAVFLYMQDIRGLDPIALAPKLWEILTRETGTFDTHDRLSLHQQNGRQLHLLLARLTDFIETQSGLPSRFMDYANTEAKNRYEVEHVWADKPEEHGDEFAHSADFREYRNRFGGLLLLPKSFNASYGALPYEKKLPHYNTQNLLARSLHPQAYDHNPGFQQFLSRNDLPFRPHERFRRADLDERQELYRAIAKQIWNPDRLLQEVWRN
jgi:hypothetical protein